MIILDMPVEMIILLRNYTITWSLTTLVSACCGWTCPHGLRPVMRSRSRSVLAFWAMSRRGILVRNTVSSSQGTVRSGGVHVDSYQRTAAINISMALWGLRVSVAYSLGQWKE